MSTFIIGAHWPMVGDSALMHYVVWLTQHRFAPYRQIAEMNLPLTYIAERTAMTVFGMDDLGWRLYDGVLVLALVGCSWRMLREQGSVAGLFAGTLFAAVHLQDGIHMAGQRDLLVTLLQAAAGCALLRALPPERDSTQPWPQIPMALLFGACSVAAACIKPPAFFFTVSGLVWLGYASSRAAAKHARGLGSVAAVLAGGALPLLLCALYLTRYGAVQAFVQDLHGLIAYHAALERRSIAFLVGHIWSPVLPFVLLTASAAALQRSAQWRRIDTLFALGAASGFLSYLVQGKGFPYQRYPFLLWTLLLCVSRLRAASRAPRRRAASGLAINERATRGRPYAAWPTVVASACGAVLIAVFLVRSTRFSNADPYAALRADLRTYNAAALDGRIQCLDTAGPCIGALYKQRLTQSTGFLYDCYLLDAAEPVVQQQRALLQEEWTARPPELIVLTNSNCFTGARMFDKYQSWPWMQRQLAKYDVVVERHPAQLLRLWNRPEQPYAYRILRRR